MDQIGDTRYRYHGSENRPWGLVLVGKLVAVNPGEKLAVVASRLTLRKGSHGYVQSGLKVSPT
jgi:hypothetical protein